MDKNILLMLTTTIGSVLCWWPIFILQNSPRPSPIPAVVALAFIALLTGFATAQSGGYWVRFWLLSSTATFFGILSGGVIWPSEDGIAQSYLLYGAMIATLVVLVVSLIASLVGRFLIHFSRSADSIN